MPIQGEIIPFNLRTGVGTQTINHIRYPSMAAKAIVFVSTANTGTNSEIFSFGVDDGVMHVGTGMGITETFGVCLSARGYSGGSYSMITEQAQASFGGASCRFRAFVSAINVGSFTITTDLNNTPNAEWFAVVLGGDDVLCKVGNYDVNPAGSGNENVGFDVVALIRVSAPDTSPTFGEVAGAYHEYGFAARCGPNQVGCAVAAGPINGLGRNFQLVSQIGGDLLDTQAVGSTPADQQSISAYPANAFSVSTPTSADWNIGYLAIGGSGVAANLVTADQPSTAGPQTIAINASVPVLAFFLSTNNPTSATVNEHVKLSFGAYDGISQVAHWWGMQSGAAFPFKRNRLSSTTQSIIMATATGPSTSTTNAQAECTGLSAGSVSLNWGTVTDSVARAFWVLVLANGVDASVPCGIVTPPIPCIPEEPAVPGGAVNPITFGSASVSPGSGVIV